METKKNIIDQLSLSQAIAVLEIRQREEKFLIKEEATEFVDSLKPVNLLRSVVRSVRDSPETKDDIIHGVVGLGTGFLAKKVLLGSLQGPLKKILGFVMQSAITSATVKYPEVIKNKGIDIFKNFLHAIKIKPDSDKEESFY